MPDLDAGTPDPTIAWAMRHCGPGRDIRQRAHEMLLESNIQMNGAGTARAPIGAEEFCLLCLNVVMNLDDELHASGKRPMPIGTCAMAARVMLSAVRLEGALQHMMRFFEMVHPGFVWKLDTQGEVASFSIALDGANDPSGPPGTDVMIVAFHMLMSWFAGRNVPLLWMSTPSRDHPALCGNDYFVKAPIRYGDHSALHFPKACLGWERRAGNPDHPISDAVRFCLEQVWDDGGARGDLASRRGRAADVQRALQEDMRLTLEDIADRLHMTSVTLWRWLQREGTSFLRIRQTLLADMAVTRLVASDVNTQDLAADLGFSDERAFRRFLKRAVGHVPSEIRQMSLADFKPPSQPEIRRRIFEKIRRFDAY